MKDLSSGVGDISSFFGFSLTQDQIQQIAEGSTFKAMKENAGNSHAGIGKVIFRKGENTQVDLSPVCHQRSRG